MTSRTSSSDSGCRVSSSDRDNSGDTTEKNGFSVVAPMNDTQRFSTAGSSASCWVLENRCTSSMNSTVCAPLMPSVRRAAAPAARALLAPGPAARPPHPPSLLWPPFDLLAAPAARRIRSYTTLAPRRRGTRGSGDGVDAGFAALCGGDGGGGAGERVEAGGRLGEGDHVADARRPGEQHYHPVPAERDPAVRRRPVLERVEQEAELRAGLLRG